MTIDDVVEGLREVEGDRSLTFLDPGDPAPGRAELRALAERHGLAPDALISRLQEELGND